MFEKLKEQPADKILALGQMFREDPRSDKTDLGIGVYKDASGKTPVMAAVRAAEKRIWDEETSKSYTALAGEPAFTKAMNKLILNDLVPAERLATISTPGGTGAVRLALDLIKRANPEATIWLSNPTWPNHNAIVKALDMKAAEYRYFDAATCGVDMEGLLADLANVKAGDAVLLHGCCHNPTGANPTAQDWEGIIDAIEAAGATALVDLAYQGFGDGLEEDAAATRRIVARLPEVLIAASCSKNFGIYRERTGALIAVAQDAADARLAQQNLNTLNRLTYSFPPDHGARIVQVILDDEELSASWKAELEAVRNGMLELRQALADELRQRSNSDRFDFIAQHRGMFSRIGATPEQVERLRTEFGIYMVGDSRINIAGLRNRETVVKLAEAMMAVGV